MRKIGLIGGIVLLALGLTVAGVIAGKDGKGNGFPEGPHYTLIIRGTDNPKNVGDSMGHTMFVRETGETRIYMTQDNDGGFKVTDRNGVVMEPDDKGNVPDARFNIADFDTSIDPVKGPRRTHWLVFARALGKPGGVVIIDPEAVFTDQLGEEVFMLDGPIVMKSHNSSATGGGKPDTVQLTGAFYVTVTIWVDANNDGIVDPGETTTYTNEWVFDIPELEDYYWRYNNSGVKVLQVRFYEDTEGLWP